MMTMRPAIALVLFLFPVAVKTAGAEYADVKYRGPVDLTPFICQDAKSSFVRRICYDEAQTYMLINLNGTWYHYCEIEHRTVDALLRAESVGQFFNASIKGRFDCRVNRVPNY